VNPPSVGYLRSPAIRGEQIVFVCEDTVWAVPASGGRARRLDTGGVAVDEPVLSPDGRLVAFAGRAGGAPDVYVMPLVGGTARRLTYQGGWLTVLGFDPAGEHVLYATDAQRPLERQRWLCRVSPDGGLRYRRG
jgi:tricorn protease